MSGYFVKNLVFKETLAGIINFDYNDRIKMKFLPNYLPAFHVAGYDVTTSLV